MLSLCDNFKIIGDGGGKLILIADTKKGQEGYIIHNPFINELSVVQDYVNVAEIGRRRNLHIPSGRDISLSMGAGNIEFIEGDNLLKLHDPVLKKTIRELLSVIDIKLDDRG